MAIDYLFLHPPRMEDLAAAFFFPIAMGVSLIYGMLAFVVLRRLFLKHDIHENR
jgi:hypothetical protein